MKSFGSILITCLLLGAACWTADAVRAKHAITTVLTENHTAWLQARLHAPENGARPTQVATLRQYRLRMEGSSALDACPGDFALAFGAYLQAVQELETALHAAQSGGMVVEVAESVMSHLLTHGNLQFDVGRLPSAARIRAAASEVARSVDHYERVAARHYVRFAR